MNYLILAAGKGSRMGNLSSYLQKCMYPVYEKPFLELILESISSNRFFNKNEDRIVLVVGHLRDQIQAYFGDSWKGIPLGYALQKEALGTAHAVMLGAAAAEAGQACVIIQGDMWVESAHLERLVEMPQADVLSIVRHECAHKHNERIDRDGDRIIRAWQGTSPFVDCGIWKFSPAMLAYMMSGKADEYRALVSVQQAIEQGLPIAALERDSWIHLGGTEPSVSENLKDLLVFFSGTQP